MGLVKFFVVPLTATFIGITAAVLFGGANLAVMVAALIVLEGSLSFDNAVINSIYLRRMNQFWQKLFLTVGIVIAVFGMRLVFPVGIVALAAHLSIPETIGLALHDHDQYAHILEGAHPVIGTFGGVFLGMIFLDWVTEDREIRWLGPIERYMSRLGKLDVASVVLMLVFLCVFARDTLFAGVLGLITYLAVGVISSFFEGHTDDASTRTAPDLVATGGLGAFLYLETMDASLSFDGVLAAFAVTSDIIVIALGLGIGALYVRTMTVLLVRKGVLQELLYLEHGAHWAIGLLAGLMFASLFVELPEVLTAVLSLSAIGGSLVSSLSERRVVQGEGSR